MKHINEHGTGIVSWRHVLMWSELQREERIIVTSATSVKATEVFLFCFVFNFDSGLELEVFRVSHENLWRFILVLNAPKNTVCIIGTVSRTSR